MPKKSSSSDVGDHRPISIIPFPSKVFEKIAARKLSHFKEGNSPLPPSHLYRRGLGRRNALLTLCHHLQVALDRGMKRRGLFS